MSTEKKDSRKHQQIQSKYKNSFLSYTDKKDMREQVIEINMLIW